MFGTMLITLGNIALLKNVVASYAQPFPSYCPQETPLAHPQDIHSLCHNRRQSVLHEFQQVGIGIASLNDRNGAV
jgi:hypothetical protein